MKRQSWVSRLKQDFQQTPPHKTLRKKTRDQAIEILLDTVLRVDGQDTKPQDASLLLVFPNGGRIDQETDLKTATHRPKLLIKRRTYNQGLIQLWWPNLKHPKFKLI